MQNTGRYEHVHGSKGKEQSVLLNLPKTLVSLLCTALPAKSLNVCGGLCEDLGVPAAPHALVQLLAQRQRAHSALDPGARLRLPLGGRAARPCPRRGVCAKFKKPFLTPEEACEGAAARAGERQEHFRHTGPRPTKPTL